MSQLVLDEVCNPASGVSGAEISDDGLYRYRLWRQWNMHPPFPGTVLWVMLNPSVADAFKDDPTLTKCIGWTKRWGYGRLEVVNIYAYRSTDPAAMFTAYRAGADIIGPENDNALEAAMNRATVIVAAWGNNGSGPRVDEITEQLRAVDARCLGRTRSGAPKHPVRLAYAAVPTITTKLVAL